MKICWICTLTVIAWVVLLISGYKLAAAILMGGSVVGAAYKISKRQTFLLSFVPIGFLAVFSILSNWWGIFALCALVLVTLAFLFWEKSPARASARAGDLEKKKWKSVVK